MSPAFKAVALTLLAELRNHQANAGCNDFNLGTIVPDVESRRKLVAEGNRLNGSPEDFDPEGTYEYTHDSMMTELLIDFITKQSDTQ